MAAPLIGVTTYGRNEGNWFELPAEYVDSVRRAGGAAVLLPPGEGRTDAWLGAVDALIVSGGGDLAPEHYGGAHRHNYNVDEERDLCELALVRRVAAMSLPVMCVCRGMQVLNVALGGTLIEHIPDEVGETIAHRLPPREPARHRVRVDAGTMLAEIMGATDVEPASWHHQAVREPANGLVVIGRAPDGVVEALHMPEHPWLLAVQWHPELTAAEDPTQQRLFDALVQEAARRRDDGSGR